jgi:hypothetical protein
MINGKGAPTAEHNPTLSQPEQMAERAATTQYPTLVWQ